MTAIKIAAFGGEIPGWEPRLLPDGQATKSLNSYLFSGNLQGWRAPTQLRTLNNPDARYVYRIPATTFDASGNAQFSTSITGTSNWLEYEDPDTNVVRSQVVSDTFQRYYVASPTQGAPTYNTLARIQANNNFFQLGIPAPTTAPIISVTGGGSSAVIGPNTSNSGSATINANVVYMFPVVPAGATLINNIQFMPLATNNAVNFRGVIYADAAIGGSAATAPGTLLGVTPTTTGITEDVLATASFLNPIALTAQTPYWIGIMMDTAESIQTTDGLNSSVQFANTFTNGPPVTAPAVQTGLSDLQMFANGTISAVVEGRTYVYTYVSAYGEEGPPSPPTLLNGWSNGTWTVQPFSPPANYFGLTSSGGNVAVIRVYRTVTSTQGAATYYFVKDISIGSLDPDAVAFVTTDIADGLCVSPTTVYTDTIPDNVVALNTPLPSTNYFPPPANLQGILALPNGIYAGFTGNQIWFSMPYLPHAWPPGFVYTVDYPIVGLGFTSGSLVVVTNGNPWTLTGTNPASMSQVKGAFSEPCLNRGSIVSTDAGVYYQSANGLIQVNSTGTMTNFTEGWITREKWALLTPQEYLRAVPFLGAYFAFGSESPPSVSPADNSVAQQGFYVDLSPIDQTSFTIWPQPGGHRIGFDEMTAPNALDIANIVVDPWTSFPLLIQSGAVYWYDFTASDYTMEPYDWTSKIYQQNTKRNFEAFRVWFTTPPNTPGIGVRNVAFPSDSSWQSLGSGQRLTVLIYADVDDGNGDGTLNLVCAREIQKSGELMRIGDGFKAENWKFRLLGRVIVSNMQVATSAKELANV